jgi:F420-dependent oxidoreductase-like protein
MRLNVMLEPQEGLSYTDILAVARQAEALGFEGLYRSDHYASVMGGEARGSTDAWATLAGLAVQTSRIRLGTMVSPVTFRPAGNLAKVVATVAGMTDGARIDLGMGTGWLETEHRQYGFPFEDVGTRFRRLEEQIQVVRGMWHSGGAPFDFDGEFEHIEGSRFLPPPDPVPRIVVGGRGMRRTPALAARYADELNGNFFSPAECARQREALHAACRDLGRDPAEVPYSLMTGCVVGATTGELHARVRRLQERSGDRRPVEEYVADRAGSWVIGTPDQARAHLRELGEAGVERVLLQTLLADDLDMLAVAAELD